MKIKHRQHYVWRKYLQAWASEDQIWCRHDGSLFKTNLINVAVINDFYKLKSLTQMDIDFIRKYTGVRHCGVLDEFNGWCIGILKSISDLHAVSKRNCDTNEKVEAELDKLIHNFEEDYHTMIEGKSLIYIDSILNEDIRFFDDDASRADFSYFLSLQYVRTRKIYENISRGCKELESKLGFNIENSWPVMRHIDAASMALSLYVSRKYRMVILINETGTSFITGDQPVLNTHVVGKFGKEIPEKVEFYYPVSPRIAILISESESYSAAQRINVVEQDVLKYNEFIKDVSHSQIYASSDSLLQ